MAVEGVLQKQALQDTGLLKSGVIYLNEYFHNTTT